MSAQVLPCDKDTTFACPGTTHGQFGDQLCAEAYEGPLCSRCRSEHYRDTITQRCERCDGEENKSGGKDTIFILAGGLAVLALVGYLICHTEAVRKFVERMKHRLQTWSNHLTMFVITWQAISNLATVHKFKVRASLWMWAVDSSPKNGGQ